MERIVVAVKAGSDQPWLVDAAAQLANQTGASVAVVSVDEVESQRYAPMPRQVYVADAERAVSAAAERLAAAGVEVTTQVRTGPAIEQILAFLEESEADLVVGRLREPRAPGHRAARQRAARAPTALAAPRARGHGVVRGRVESSRRVTAGFLYLLSGPAGPPCESPASSSLASVSWSPACSSWIARS